MHGENEPITPYRQVYLVDSTHYRFKILEQLVFWDVLIKDAVSLIKFFHKPSHNLFKFFKQICHPWQPHRSSLNFSLKIGAGYGRRREEEMGHVCAVEDPNFKSLNAFLPQIHWKGKWCTDSYFIWWNSLLVIRDHLMTNDLKYLWI